MRVCKIALVLLALLAPTIARGDEFAPGRLIIAGTERGYWWPLATADVLREEHKLVPQLRLQLDDKQQLIDKLNERLDLKEKLVLQLKYSSGLSETRAQVAEGALEAALKGQLVAERAQKDCEARAHAWYRHPALWFAVGAIVSAGATGAAFALTN